MCLGLIAFIGFTDKRSVLNCADILMTKNVRLNLHARNIVSSLITWLGQKIWSGIYNQPTVLTESLLSAWEVERGSCEIAERRRWRDDKNESGLLNNLISSDQHKSNMCFHSKAKAIEKLLHNITLLC